MSPAGTAAIVIGIIVVIIIIGVAIYFYSKSAITKASYNGGGSGNNKYIRTWIDKYAVGSCPYTSRYGKLKTQDGKYYLCYNSGNNKITLQATDGFSSSGVNKNVWYFCFRNKNSTAGNISSYSGTLVSLQTTDTQKNATWMCSTTGLGDMKCSKTSTYSSTGNYKPAVFELNSYCSTVAEEGRGGVPLPYCDMSTSTCGTCTTFPCAPCMAYGNDGLLSPYATESFLYINEDDTISTIPDLSTGEGVGYMNSVYYTILDSQSGKVYPSIIRKVALRFNIEDCGTEQSCS